MTTQAGTPQAATALGWNLGLVNERMAAAIPEAEALIYGDRRFTHGELAERSRRFANVLHDRGLGLRRPRQELANWECGQDTVALYLHNCSEYLEAMLGSYKARAVPFNVNFRYTAGELCSLLERADARGVLYHASLAPVLDEARKGLPNLGLLIRVEDGSGTPPISGSVDYEKALGEAATTLPPVEPSADDLYVLFTGGTTGEPKGALWRQEDIFYAAMAGQGIRQTAEGMKQYRYESIEEMLEVATAGAAFGIKSVVCAPLMHAAGQWSSFGVLHSGGAIILNPTSGGFDAHRIWRLVEAERPMSLTIVGDAFARPLLDALSEGGYDNSSVMMVGGGGVTLSPSVAEELLEAFPNAMVGDGFGSTETGSQGIRQMTRATGVTGVFDILPQSTVLNAALTGLFPAGSDELGWAARTGNIPLGYLGDPERSRTTFPVIEGVRYSVPGDRARINAEGRIELLGRGSECINTGGEKVFVEEVESALRVHPAVYDVMVVGAPSRRWGEQVVALVSTRPGDEIPTREALIEPASAALARYKLPKQVIHVPEIRRHPSGKPDYVWGKQIAAEHVQSESGRDV